MTRQLYLLRRKRFRGPRRVRSRIGWWPVAIFVILCLAAAIIGAPRLGPTSPPAGQDSHEAARPPGS